MAQKKWSQLVEEAGDSIGGGTFEAIPDGEYDFVVTEASHRITSSQKPMYVITAEVQDGPYAKRKVWHNFVVSEDNKNAMGFFFDNMRKLGIAVDFFKADPSEDAVVAALTGRRFRGMVGHREYQGKVRNDIKTFFASRTAPGSLTTAPSPAPQVAVQVPSPVAASVDAGIPSVPPPF